MSQSQELEQDDYPAVGYAWYVVGVLTIAYIFSFIDRQIISLLVGPIKRDLNISDTQISYLMGLSFAVFYTLFGIPLGWLADRKSRRGIISLGVTFWSLMTAGCGITKNFWQLAFMRMGVGVGEATLSPAAYSLIADYFPPRRRATAMSVYSMGIYVGSGLAFVLGGQIAQLASSQENYLLPWLGAVRSWQLVFFAVGLPGLLVALLLLTVREPQRHQQNSSGIATLGETWNYLLHNRGTFLYLNLGVAMVTLSAYASTSWIPAMFIRRFDWSLGQTGLVYGAIISIFGTMGVVGGGWLADRWSHHGCLDAPLRVALIGCLCGLPCAVAYPLASTGELTAWLLIPMVFCSSLPFGVAPAAIQRMMPRSMRAQATAIYLFVINIIGMGMGPTVTAYFTDNVYRNPKMVHYSLLIVGVASYLIASLLLALSLKSYRASLEYLRIWSEKQSA